MSYTCRYIADLPKAADVELRIFLLADFANVDAGSKLNIIGAFNTVSVRDIPTVHPAMYLVAKVAADLGEYDTTRTYKVLFYDADANELGKLEGAFAFPNAKAGGYSEWNLILAFFQLTFPHAGRYEFRLLVDEHLLGVVPLDVVQTADPTHPQE